MDLNVGEFVRTKNGDIFKFAEFYDRTPLYSMKDENGILYGNPNKVVKRHSFKIIDLIEICDYVNGHLVVGFNEEVDINGYKYKEIEIESDHLINHYLKLEDIKSIVTKEQFDSMKYKVGEENE